MSKARLVEYEKDVVLHFATPEIEISRAKERFKSVSSELESWVDTHEAMAWTEPSTTFFTFFRINEQIVELFTANNAHYRNNELALKLEEIALELLAVAEDLRESLE